MTISTPDRFWQPHTLTTPLEIRPWLRNRGSLTHRIQQHCQQFRVQTVQQRRARIRYDQAQLLGLPPHQQAYCRQVILHADQQPVVFAHSCCRPQHLSRQWAAIRGLGNQPLGALLFSHPDIQRRSLHFKQLNAHDPLYRMACQALSAPPPRLWARRSLFVLYQAPLLVSEVFLPAIYQLKACRTAGCTISPACTLIP